LGNFPPFWGNVVFRKFVEFKKKNSSKMEEQCKILKKRGGGRLEMGQKKREKRGKRIKNIKSKPKKKKKKKTVTSVMVES
jgi:hypothetical protein